MNENLYLCVWLLVNGPIVSCAVALRSSSLTSVPRHSYANSHVGCHCHLHSLWVIEILLPV